MCMLFGIHSRSCARQYKSGFTIVHAAYDYVTDVFCYAKNVAF